MGEAYLIPSIPSIPSSDVKTIYYVGTGPIYTNTYDISLREVDLGDTPSSISLIGYSGNNLHNYGRFMGSISQGSSCMGPGSPEYIKLEGSKLYVCSWTYQANAGFQFYANNPNAVYIVMFVS